MAIYSIDDIVAIFDNGKVIYAEFCGGDYSNVEMKDIITDAAVSDATDLYFCDQCGKQL